MSGKSWHRRRPADLEHIRQKCSALQPEMFCVVEKDTVYLRGTFALTNGGKVLDRYDIEVEFPHDYWHELPIVRETASRIPRTADRHMYPDGRTCLFILDEFWWQHPNGVDFETFLDQIVASFYISQSYYEIHGEWLFGEREHNEEGPFNFYSEILGTEDRAVILRYLDYVARGAHGHWDCPCGSGSKLRRCHGEQYEKLRDRIQPHVAARTCRQLLDAAKVQYLQRLQKTVAER